MAPRRLRPWLVWIFLFAPSLANAEYGDDRTLSPYFFVEGGDPGTDRLPLLGTRVEIAVSGVIADVTVRQTYKNDGARPIHATYVFPASTRAAVHGLVMTIDDRRISARIKEREEASREFTAAKKAGKNAALLEQERPNVFTMKVANIVPGQRIDVELRYSELLVPVAGVYEFVYPTVVGPRYSTVPEAGAAPTDAWLETPYTPERVPPAYTFSLDAVLNAGLPIRELSSPSHVIRTRWADPARVRVELSPDERDGGNRDFVLRYRLDGGRIQSGLLLYEGKDENFFLMMVQPPERIAPAEIPPREYIFVVDVSGSMRGFPLDTAKSLLRDLIGGLRPVDTFNLVLFSADSRLWSPVSRPALPEHIEDAVALLGEESGGGGTELLAALRRAMALPREDGRSRSLLVVTDGYIAVEKDVFSAIRESLGDANVFAFGIGSSVNRHFIEGIARAGMGEPFVVLDEIEAPEAAARFRDYVKSPTLAGVRIRMEGFEAYDVEPASIPDLMAERPIIVHGKWWGAPRGHILVTGTTGRGAYRRTLDVSGAVPDTANIALRHLWARARIADLTDRALAEETDADREELVALGLRYNLLTRHTSFVAVDEVIRNPRGGGEDVAQPLPLPMGVSDTAIGSMGVGSEPELWSLLVAALLGGAVIVMRRRVARVGS